MGNLFRCSGNEKNNKKEFPPIRYYVNGASASSHQSNVNLEIILNGKYTNMNITIGDPSGWGNFTINNVSYTTGTYNVSLVGLERIIILNRTYANSGLHMPFVINSIE